MYCTTIPQIENSYLHDAAMTLSHRVDSKGNSIYKLRSIYIDPSGECAISYYGHLTEQQIKEIMINFCYPYEDKSYDDISPVERQDYVFSNPHGTDKEGPYTQIYTPDGLDYRALKF